MLLFAAELRAFLDHADRSPDTLKYPELQGFLFAVANAPEVVLPSEWFPEVFGGDMPVFENEDEARTIHTALIEEYNAVNGASIKHVTPPGCLLRDDPMANFEDDAPIRAWARGFAQGYGWLEETWSAYLPVGPYEDPQEQEMDEEFGSVLMVLTFFASRQLAEEIARETAHPDVNALAATVHEMFPAALAEYIDLASLIQRVRDEAEHAPYQRDAPKTGRNDLCPCGSGRKYKRCCGAASGPPH